MSTERCHECPYVYSHESPTRPGGSQPEWLVPVLVVALIVTVVLLASG